MKKILLVHLPFCTPASPSYSIAYLYSFLKKNTSFAVEVLDLNIEYHKRKFPDFYKYFASSDWKDYDAMSRSFRDASSEAYSANNRKVVDGSKPEFFDLFASMINSSKADIVAFSIVYSSQAFYAYSLMPSIDAFTIIGGPAVNSKIPADAVLEDEVALLRHVEGNFPPSFDFAPDFSCFKLSDYFTPAPVIPIKTSSSCYHRKCSFCTHFNTSPYKEFDASRFTVPFKHIFLIDDMISSSRLLSIAPVFSNSNWACQLKPTADFTFDVLKKLYCSGLKMIMWGVESGNDRLLKLMNKGTNAADMSLVLKASHEAGIKNVVYMLFGFPSETKPEFLDTVDFLLKNSSYIDLVSPSLFGLQRGTEVFANPSKFGVSKITEISRTVLEPKISYEVSEGLSNAEAAKLLESHRKEIEKINKFPKVMNFFREHMLVSIR